jgi:DNA-directed RNA polymerase subunit RPC12/RpoP
VDEVYLCPICNTRVNASQTECPGCGAIFSDSDDEDPSSQTTQTDPSVAGADTPLEYRCPACGGSVRDEDETCPHCGALFVEDAEEVTPPPPPPKAKAKAKAKPKPPAEEPEGVTRSGLEGLKLPSISGPGTATAATRRRESPAVRHSRAVIRLSKRRKLIAQRRMLGLALLAAGFAIYIGSLMINQPSGFTMGSAFTMAISITFLLLGVLILYNQYHAWRHYQAQLQTARIEATLLRDGASGAETMGGKAKSAPPVPKVKPEPPKAVAPQRVRPPTVKANMVEAKVVPQKRVVTGAAAAAADNMQMPRGTPEPRRVELVPEPIDDPDKVACPNCGYLNRSIFVRCIRCGNELSTKDESISVETFERPEESNAHEAPRPRGGPTPWEARHASAQGGRAAARQAARQAARTDVVEEVPASEDRRAAIGVAANFTKLPKNMREELIRTLYKVSDPAVRQDTVSAIAEHYTELPKDIQDLLIELTDDEDPRVREEVAFEVNHNFDRIPLNIIQTIFNKLARDPENLVREDVVSAIAENFQRLPKETQDLLKLLAADQKESVRDEVSFEVAKNSDIIPEKFKSEIKEILRQTGS